MQITFDNMNEDGIDAFLVIVQTDPTSGQELSHRYKISPTGIKIGSIPHQSIAHAEEQIDKYPVQILFEDGVISWNDLADTRGTYIHGTITKKKDTAASEVLQLGKFSFEFGIKKRDPIKISNDTYEISQKDAVTNTNVFHIRYLRWLLRWEIERHRRLSGLPGKPLQLLPISLLKIGIDRFKERRLREGNFTIDTILKEVARRLQNRVRSTDIIARWEEGFIIYLPDTPEEKALEFSKKVVRQIEEIPPFLGEDHKIDIGISIGVAAYQPNMNADELLEALDIRFLEAKKTKT